MGEKMDFPGQSQSGDSKLKENIKQLEEGLQKFKDELHQISLELDLGLIDEGDMEYIEQNRDKISRAAVLGAKIDQLENLIKTSPNL